MGVKRRVAFFLILPAIFVSASTQLWQNAPVLNDWTNLVP